MNNEKFQALYKNTKKEEIIEELYYKCKANNELVSEIERLKESEEYYRKGFIELHKRIEETLECIENEIPCLWEIDDVWEDINGNYQHNYKEYSIQILSNKLKGVDKE